MQVYFLNWCNIYKKKSCWWIDGTVYSFLTCTHTIYAAQIFAEYALIIHFYCLNYWPEHWHHWLQTIPSWKIQSFEKEVGSPDFTDSPSASKSSIFIEMMS